MGIYPQFSKSKEEPGNDGSYTWTETRQTPGLTETRTVVASAWKQNRTDCFCCTCSEEALACDPFCRNHGFAGRRPCDVHNMPGEVDEHGVMPISVKEYRKLYGT